MEGNGSGSLPVGVILLCSESCDDKVKNFLQQFSGEKKEFNCEPEIGSIRDAIEILSRDCGNIIVISRSYSVDHPMSGAYLMVRKEFPFLPTYRVPFT